MEVLIMSAPPTPTAAPPSLPALALEQYKSYLQDLGNIGTRYTTSNGFYLSIITALLGILALTKPGETLMDLQSILRLTVPLFATMVCWVWYRTLIFYRAIFLAKFTVLRELEEYGGLFPAYEHERDLFLKTRAGWLIENERRIALLLILLFLIVFVATIVNTWGLR